MGGKKTFIAAVVAATALTTASAAQAASNAACTLIGPMTLKSGGGVTVKGKARCHGRLDGFLLDPTRGSFELTSTGCGKAPQITLSVPRFFSWDPRSSVLASASLRTLGLGSNALLAGTGRSGADRLDVSGAAVSLNLADCESGDLRLDLSFSSR